MGHLSLEVTNRVLVKIYHFRCPKECPYGLWSPSIPQPVPLWFQTLLLKIKDKLQLSRGYKQLHDIFMKLYHEDGYVVAKHDPLLKVMQFYLPLRQ